VNGGLGGGAPRYDDADGVGFSAKGRASWEVDLNRLAEFMQSTEPPFPVDTSRVEGRYGVSRGWGILTPGGKEVDVETLVKPGPVSNNPTIGGGVDSVE
jgi:hypothetical protein